MTRRLLVALVLLVPMAVLSSCLFGWKGAEARSGSTTVRMELRPMFGIHSDWHRRLVLEAPGGRLEHALFEDTGWWRGSALYRLADGTLLLHEGQGDCLHFAADPPALLAWVPQACRTPAPGMRLTEALPGLTYLGRFDEAGESDWIRWTDAAAAEEPVLPAPL